MDREMRQKKEKKRVNIEENKTRVTIEGNKVKMRWVGQRVVLGQQKVFVIVWARVGKRGPSAILSSPLGQLSFFHASRDYQVARRLEDVQLLMAGGHYLGITIPALEPLARALIFNKTIIGNGADRRYEIYINQMGRQNFECGFSVFSHCLFLRVCHNNSLNRVPTYFAAL